MNKLTLAQMLAKKLNVSTEDNAQVEVNFNIDTDEDGAPSEDAVETNIDEEVKEDAKEDLEGAEETSESDGEVDAAESDMDQLQEAQDSLESLGIVLNKHVNNGSMSRMGVGFYQIALEALVGNKILSEVGVPSLESHSYSKQHATLLSLESHSELTSHLNVVSLEAHFNWLKKLGHKISLIFTREKALLKRAKALNVIADGSTNEKASNDNIQVNNKKGLELPILLSMAWSDDQQFINHIKDFTKLYIDMEAHNGGFDDDFVDDMFPGSLKWPKGTSGKPTKTMFGMKLIRDKLVEGHTAERNIRPSTVVNLTPKTCKTVLADMIVMLEKGDMVIENLEKMMRLMNQSAKVKRTNSETFSTNDSDGGLGMSQTTNEETTYPDGYVEMLRTVDKLLTLKMDASTEILNYVNYSLTDREFN